MMIRAKYQYTSMRMARALCLWVSGSGPGCASCGLYFFGGSESDVLLV